MRKFLTIISFLWLGITAYSQTSCQAGFIYSISPNGTVAFYDSSIHLEPITTSTWYFGDTIPVYGLNITQTYNTSGQYQVCHIIQTDSCTSALFCDTLIINIDTCHGLSVSVNPVNDSTSIYGAASAIVSGGTAPFQYVWSNGSTQQIIQGLPFGNYCVTVYDSQGCSTHACDTIYYSSCNVGFSFTQDTISITTFHFTDSSIVNPNPNYYWLFDNTFNETVQNPDFNFNSSGVHTVILTISGFHCFSSFYDTISIATPPCQALIDIDTISQWQYGFNNYSTTSNNDSLYSSYWTFSDNTSDSAMNTSHIFQQSGTYQTCLHIQTYLGCSSDTCISITIPQDTSCHANFNYNILNTVGQYQFTNTSLFNPGDSASYQWIVGNTNISTSLNTVFVFQSPGTYNVSLIIQTSHQCIDTIHQIITINPTHDCHANFSIDSVNANCGSLCYKFVDSSYAASFINNWQWNFGDGSPLLYGQNQIHTFPNSGNYQICINIYTSFCRDSICKYLTIPAPPSCHADFTIDTITNCGIGCITMTSTSTPAASITSCQWNFGDGTTGTGTTINHTYLTSGIKTIRLVIITSNSCSDTSYKYQNIITPLPLCTVDFTYSSTLNASYFNFTNRSLGNIISTHWTFGNGITSDLQNPAYAFADSGNHSVCLFIKILNQTNDTISCNICKNIFTQFANTVSYSIQGKVHKENALLANGQTLLFYQNGNYFNAIQYQQPLSDGTFNFKYLSPGYYLLYSVPDPDTEINYFPGYFVNRLNWQASSLIHVTGNVYDVDIYLPRKPMAQSGNGNIGGYISFNDAARYEKNIYNINWFDDTFESSTGNAARNIPVLLFDSANKDSVAWAISDQTGHFSFSGIPYGQYVLNVQKPGLLPNESPVITLNSGSPQNNNIAITLRTNDISFNLTDVAETEIFNGLTVYPNPVKNELNICLKNNITDGLLLVFNTLGELIFSGNINFVCNNQQLKIDTRHFPNGIYFGKIESTTATYQFRFIK